MAIKNDIANMIMYFLSNNNKISLCVAPCTFRIAISRYLCCMSNKDNPNKAIEDWKIQCKLPPKTKRFCPLVLK